MAFTLLMRLPQRLEAERESDDDALAPYLDDPLQFFVPARLHARHAAGPGDRACWRSTSSPAGSGGIVLFASGLGLAVGVGQFAAGAHRAARRRSACSSSCCRCSPLSPTCISPLTALIIRFLGLGRAPAARAPTGDAGAPRRRRRAADAAAPARGREPAAAIGRGFRRDAGARSDDAAARHRRDPRRTRRSTTCAQLVQEQEYSRLPVFTENLDNIVGLVVVKDLIQSAGRARRAAAACREIMRPAAFVPETKRVMDLLREFQQKRVAAGDRRRRVRRHGRPGHRRGRRRGARRRDSRRVRHAKPSRSCAKTTTRYVFSAKVAIERDGRSPAASRSRTASSRPSAATCWRASAACRRWASGSTFDGLDVEILEAERRRIHKVRIRRLPRRRGGGGE